jgi:hypothetical protein
MTAPPYFEISQLAREHLTATLGASGLAVVMPVLEFVWGLSDRAHSLYLRGSMARQTQPHAPVDIDLYYLLVAEDAALADSYALSEEVRQRFAGAPILDLSYFTCGNLLDPGKRLMTKLILLHDGLCVCGPSIVPRIEPVTLDLQCALAISYKQSIIVEKKLLAAQRLSPGAPAHEQSYLMSSVAKAVLRLVMPVFIARDARFTRDANACASYIEQHRPDLASRTRALRRVLGGERVGPADLLRDAVALYEALCFQCLQPVLAAIARP